MQLGQTLAVQLLPSQHSFASRCSGGPTDFRPLAGADTAAALVRPASCPEAVQEKNMSELRVIRDTFCGVELREDELGHTGGYCIKLLVSQVCVPGRVLHFIIQLLVSRRQSLSPFEYANTHSNCKIIATPIGQTNTLSACGIVSNKRNLKAMPNCHIATARSEKDVRKYLQQQAPLSARHRTAVAQKSPPPAEEPP